MKRLVSLTIIALGLSGSGALAAMKAPAPVPTPKNSGPIVNFCTGKLDGNYYRSAGIISRMNRSVTIQPRETKGAGDNVRFVTDGSCDFGFTQADTLMGAREDDPAVETNTQRIIALYDEYAHLLCNRKSGITKVQQLTSKSVVAIGEDGSGSYTSWQRFVASDKKKYSEVKKSDLSGKDALMAVADGAEATCMLYMGGVGNTLLKKDAQKFADKVVLVNLNDGDFGTEKDASGENIYTYVQIPSSTYGAIQPSGMLFGKAPIKTVATKSVIIVNRAWKDANRKLYESLLDSITSANAAIVKAATPTN